MAVQYPFGFEIGNNEPIDSRFVFLDLASRDALLSINRYEGLKVYVVTEGTFYSLIGGIENSNWTADGTGGTSSSNEIFAPIANDVSVPTALIPESFTNSFYSGISFEYQLVRESDVVQRKIVKGTFTRIYNADGTDTFKSGDKIGDIAEIGVSIELNPVTGLLEYTSSEFAGIHQGFIKLFNFQKLSLVSGGEGIFQSAPIENNVTTPTPVIGNLFPSSSNVGVIFTAFIHREVSGLEYNSLITRSVVYTSSGVKQDGTRVGDNAGVTFNLDPLTGELRYTSTEMVEAASEYLGFINFYKLIPLKIGAGPTSSSTVSLPTSLTGQVELSDIYNDSNNDGIDTMLLTDARKLIRVETVTNGAFQFDVPAFMNARGTIMTLLDLGGNLDNEPITVVFSGGATVMGAPSLVLSTPNISYRFIYMDETNDWRVMEGAGISVSLLNGVPTGAIIPFGGTSAPAGYTLADGGELPRTSDLFAIYGTVWGEGDGSTTFNKPKLNGRTLRFVDDGEGVDPDAATRTALFAGGNVGDTVGSYQDDQVESHSHSGSATVSGFRQINVLPSGTGQALSFTQGGAVSGSISVATASTGGAETRMKNANVYALIKL
jgi:microcystin-dependent protein